MTLQIVQFLEDNIEELAHSPLMVETSSKTGKGLEKGLNPTLDLLVDKYFTLPESDDPDEDIIRFRESNTARHVLLLINCILETNNNYHCRFEGKSKLEYMQRKHFTNQYGETSTHILSEVFRHHPIAFGLPKDSMFTAKFGKIIRYVIEQGLNRIFH